MTTAKIRKPSFRPGKRIYPFLLQTFARTFIISILTFILILVIFEIKYRYKLDLLPGINFTADDYYREVKASILGSR